MVRGRLPRESNPVPGQSQPGFVPAFDETGNEDYVRVSNQKPYPVANYTQNASGVWLPTSQNNPMPTQLTGSKVEQLEVTFTDVPPGVSQIFSFKPPVGELWDILYLQADIRSSGTGEVVLEWWLNGESLADRFVIIKGERIDLRPSGVAASRGEIIYPHGITDVYQL